MLDDPIIATPYITSHPWKRTQYKLNSFKTLTLSLRPIYKILAELTYQTNRIELVFPVSHNALVIRIWKIRLMQNEVERKKRVFELLSHTGNGTEDLELKTEVNSISPLGMTSKRSSWEETSKFSISTEQIIDENSIKFMNLKSKFLFL